MEGGGGWRERWRVRWMGGRGMEGEEGGIKCWLALQTDFFERNQVLVGSADILIIMFLCVSQATNRAGSQRGHACWRHQPPSVGDGTLLQQELTCLWRLLQAGLARGRFSRRRHKLDADHKQPMSSEMASASTTAGTPPCVGTTRTTVHRRDPGTKHVGTRSLHWGL